MFVEKESFPPSGLSLTFGVDTKAGVNTYNFADRGAYIAAAREQQKLSEGQPFSGGPWTMEIMPTDACNVGCPWCSYREVRREHLSQVRELQQAGEYSARPYLSSDNVMNLLDDLEAGGDTKGTYWAGGGEPLTAPYIVEALQRAATFSDVFVQTNGILLKKLTKSPDFLGSVRLLSISAVGFDEESTARVHQKNTFQNIDTNVRTVMDMRNRFRKERGEEGLGRLKVNAKIMVDQTNYTMLPEMVHYWRDDLGVDILAIRLVQDYHYGASAPQGQSVELSPAQKDELFAVITKYCADDHDLMRFAWFLRARGNTIPPTLHCFTATQGHFAAVDAKGDVFVGNPEISDPNYVIGNIKNQPWKNIWGSERHKEVVDRMDREYQHGTCKIALCRHTTANQGVQQYIDGQRPAASKQEIMDKGFGAFM